MRAAAEAMGGVDRVQAVKTVVIEGEGSAPNLGQNVTPDGDLPVWKVTDFKRSIDFTHGSIGSARMREQQVRTAQFLFALATTQRQNQGLDGAVAYNIGGTGNAVRASDAAAQDRRRQLLHHPLTLVRAALEPDAKLTNFRQEGGMNLLDITLAQGGTFTLAIDGSTHLPAKVTSMSYDPNLGDVAIATAFSDYQETGGLKLPMRVTTRIDKYPQFDLQVSKYTIDADVGDLAAPDAVKSAAPPVPGPQVVTAQQVAQGIWWLAGSGNHRSIVFEFADHLTLFEVPVNEARSLAVIEKARSLSSKPLTTVIVSHHHFDHSGGLRAAVSQGLTIITYRGNVEFFQELVARKHTIVPDALAKHDALAKNPQPLKIVPVDDQMTLKDSSMEVRLYHVKDNPREGTLLMAYVPRDRILVQADLYDSGWLQHPWADNFAWNLRERGLQVDKDVPVHGEIQTYAEVLKTIQATKSKQAKSGRE